MPQSKIDIPSLPPQRAPTSKYFRCRLCDRTKFIEQRQSGLAILWSQYPGHLSLANTEPQKGPGRQSEKGSHSRKNSLAGGRKKDGGAKRTCLRILSLCFSKGAARLLRQCHKQQVRPVPVRISFRLCRWFKKKGKKKVITLSHNGCAVGSARAQCDRVGPHTRRGEGTAGRALSSDLSRRAHNLDKDPDPASGPCAYAQRATGGVFVWDAVARLPLLFFPFPCGASARKHSLPFFMPLVPHRGKRRNTPLRNLGKKRETDHAVPPAGVDSVAQAKPTRTASICESACRIQHVMPFCFEEKKSKKEKTDAGAITSGIKSACVRKQAKPVSLVSLFLFLLFPHSNLFTIHAAWAEHNGRGA